MRGWRRPAVTAAAGALLAAAVLVAGCGGGDGDGAAAGDAGGDGGIGGTLTVFAAASLTDAFQALGGAFEAAHPAVSVRFSFAGSSSLAASILEGAPADVFASADVEVMREVVDAGAAADPVTFARNRLAIAVPAGNPAGVDGLDDLGRGSLLVGLCAEAVPCGAAARQALVAAGVTPAPDTVEPHVRALLTKVEAGELDVGLVYRTDVLAAGDAVDAVDLPAEADVVTTYPAAVLDEAPNPTAAVAFVDLLTGPDGRQVLERWGFLAP